MNEFFSKEKLIDEISGVKIYNSPMKYELDIDFNNISVNVKFIITGYFHIQDQTHENPPIEDLYDVYIDIIGLSIIGPDSQKSLPHKEVLEIEQEVIKKIKTEGYA